MKSKKLMFVDGLLAFTMKNMNFGTMNNEGGDYVDCVSPSHSWFET